MATAAWSNKMNLWRKTLRRRVVRSKGITMFNAEFVPVIHPKDKRTDAAQVRLRGGCMIQQL